MRPLALVFDGREHPLGGMWQNLPIVLCHLLDALHPNLLRGFANAGFIPHLSPDGADLRRGQEIADLGVWFEKNLSARDFIGQARKMLEAFRVDPAQAALKMEPRDAQTRAPAKPCEWPAAENPPAPGNAIVPPFGRAGRPAPPPASSPAPSASSPATSAAHSPTSPAPSPTFPAAHSPTPSPAHSAAALAPSSPAPSLAGSAAGFCRARVCAPATASAPAASAPAASPADAPLYRLRYDEWRARDNAVTGRQPVALVVGGERHGVSKWKDLLIATCDVLSRLDRQLLRAVVEGMERGCARLFDPGTFNSPYHHEPSGVWLETTQSAESIVGFSRRLFEECGIDLSTVELLFRDKAATPWAAAPRDAQTRAPAKPAGGGAGRPALPDGASSPATASAPAPSSGDRIGAYAKREIYAALAEGRVPDDDFARLQTLEGTKEIVGILPHGCPVFALELAPAGRERVCYWKDCAYRGGVPVFVNSQWEKDRHEAYLERLLARWRVAAPAPWDAQTRVPAKPAGGGAGCPALPDGASSASSPAVSAAAFAHTSAATSPAPAPLTDAQRANLAELLEAEFSNGFRLSSYIHEKKIRELHSRRFGEDLPEDLDLAQVMPHIGVLVDGKVFPRPSSKDGGWRKIVDGLVEEGHEVFQFSRLMARHADDLMRLGVVSLDLLHAAVVREAPDAYEMKDEFLLRKGVGDAADAVLKRLVAGDSAIVEIKSAARRLPYVEESHVNELLRRDRRFVWNAKDEYAILERIEFDDAEAERGRGLCESCIREDGFFSLSHLVLEDSAAMNDSRLSDSALRNAFYFRFLDGRFTRHGRMVHEVGVDVPASAPLRALCRNRNDDVSYDEIYAIAQEYKIDIRTALDAVCAERVRVSQNRFARAELVEFDVEAVNAAIALRMAGAATPFGAFGDFRDFPAVPGYEWNGFLLEAYLHYSRRYRFFSLSPSVNEVAGVVAEAKAGFADEFDAFAAAAVAARVPSEQEAVGDFLVSSRCALRRGKTMLESVVGAMRKRETRAK